MSGFPYFSYDRSFFPLPQCPFSRINQERRSITAPRVYAVQQQESGGDYPMSNISMGRECSHTETT